MTRSGVSSLMLCRVSQSLLLAQASLNLVSNALLFDVLVPPVWLRLSTRSFFVFLVFKFFCLKKSNSEDKSSSLTAGATPFLSG